MSLRTKRGGARPAGGRYGGGLAGGFSSASLGSFSPNATIKSVSVNANLLTPVNVDIDPDIQAVRTQEKNDIKGLNNRFASFIDKVRQLEQQNKVLETKWKLLSEQSEEESRLEPLMKSYIVNLQMQLETILNDKEALCRENTTMHKDVDHYTNQYEEEFNKKTLAENDFVLIKKDVDAGYLTRVDLEDSFAGMTEEMLFLSALHETELEELRDSLKDTSVVVQMDNSRGLDMDHIVAQVKAQYQEIATRSCEEAETAYKSKFDQMATQADHHNNELRKMKSEIADLTRLMGRLQSDIQAVKAQESSLEKQLSEAEDQGEQATRDAERRIKDLEQALQRAKQDMAGQIREYQDLMNIKLALDIEISTYRKLLEGEEDRVGQPAVINIQTLASKPVTEITRTSKQDKLPPIVIKVVETQGNITSYINEEL